MKNKRFDQDRRRGGDLIIVARIGSGVTCPLPSTATTRLSAAPARSSACAFESAAMAPYAAEMLDLIGVAPGWSCLDIGCGPGGITSQMSERVGTAGRVVGIDMDAEFLELARAAAQANVEFRQGDAYQANLPAGSFDLVHMRFVASTAGDPERLLAEAIRLARPGGVVALEEPDAATLDCYPPHPAFDRLKAALIGAFQAVGADLHLAKRLYALARMAGLTDVEYRPFLVGIRSIDPLVDYLPSTVESLRSTIIKFGLLSEAEFSDVVAACRSHLRNPEVSFTLYSVARVWGRTSSSKIGRA